MLYRVKQLIIDGLVLVLLETDFLKPDYRESLSAGSLNAIDVAQFCLAEISEKEPDIQAWAWFDANFAQQQANDLDDRYNKDGIVRPLQGMPVGIKDVIDTAEIPTENGTVLDRGRIPDTDAEIVSRLKSAGSVLMGKTVTAELSHRTPGKTRNPYNFLCTPGGSSSGSAAAVAAGMVPVAIGTQSSGSVVQAASYCGIVGYKPTRGLIPMDGILSISPSLDAVGVFANSLSDAALVADVLCQIPEKTASSIRS